MDSGRTKRRRLDDNFLPEPQLQHARTQHSISTSGLLNQPVDQACSELPNKERGLDNCVEAGNIDNAEPDDRPLEDPVKLDGQCCYGMVSKR